MFYTCVGGNYIVGGSIAEVLKQLPTIPRYNDAYIKQTLVKGLWSYPIGLFDTMFEGIYRVPLGYQMPQNGMVHPVRQWSFDSFTNQHPLSFDEAVAGFNLNFQQSISKCVSSQKLAIEVSGGLDSAAVAAFARFCYPNLNITAFSNGVPKYAPDKIKILSKEEKKEYNGYAHDDSTWSKLVSEHLDLEYHQINNGYHFHDILEQYTEILGSFTEVLFPILNHRCYEIAKSLGVKTLLSGYGGDEVVSQHAGLYLTELRAQKNYSKYLFEKIMSKNSKICLTILNVLKQKKSIWIPNTEHLDYLHIGNVLQDETIIRPKTIKEAESFFIEGPLSIHWQRRIETSTIIAKHYDIDMQFPLANPELMGFFHQLPSSYKFHNGKGRYLFRKSLEGLLPKSVIWRSDSKKGATAPAALVDLVVALPELFLSRITKDHSGTIANYVNIPKLVKRVESAPIFESNLLRLCVIVLMFAHLEKWINNIND